MYRTHTCGELRLADDHPPFRDAFAVQRPEVGIAEQIFSAGERDGAEYREKDAEKTFHHVFLFKK